MATLAAWTFRAWTFRAFTLAGPGSENVTIQLGRVAARQRLPIEPAARQVLEMIAARQVLRPQSTSQIG